MPSWSSKQWYGRDDQWWQGQGWDNQWRQGRGSNSRQEPWQNPEQAAAPEDGHPWSSWAQVGDRGVPAPTPPDRGAASTSGVGGVPAPTPLDRGAASIDDVATEDSDASDTLEVGFLHVVIPKPPRAPATPLDLGAASNFDDVATEDSFVVQDASEQAEAPEHLGESGMLVSGWLPDTSDPLTTDEFNVWLEGPQREAAPEQPGAGVGGVLAPIPPTPPTSATKELEDLRAHEAWLCFQELVENAVEGGHRQALAQHTTTSNQPRRAPGTAVSLNTCGVDEKLRTGGEWICRLALPNLLRLDDGIQLEVVSPPQATFKVAQKKAIVETLAYILFRGPELLKAHQSQWRDRNTFQDVKIAARKLRDDLGPRPHGRTWTPLDDGDGTPSEMRASAPRGAAAYYQPLGEGDNEAARDERILAALRSLPHRKTVTRYPVHVYEVLRVEIAPGRLLDFLKRFPREFSIETERPLAWWRR